MTGPETPEHHPLCPKHSSQPVMNFNKPCQCELINIVITETIAQTVETLIGLVGPEQKHSNTLIDKGWLHGINDAIDATETLTPEKVDGRASRRQAERDVWDVIDALNYEHRIDPENCECLQCEEAGYLLAAARGDYSWLKTHGWHLNSST